ncbi:hypothetical protein [Brumimicrobium oceani]|uniref:Septum formation inhibitor Maf n=1 Tax=Brumimicrobium oceani TaxID=2100725 RepID=A0A2U2XH70_9FLAO|nr:hypothetical protein [Brumimicrobium oceani]PWH87061.1 hypothetical protein DIT68_02025 [Brumimicrobium oceani]
MKLNYYLLPFLMLLLGCENKTAETKKTVTVVDAPIAVDHVLEEEPVKEKLSNNTFNVDYFSGKAEIATYTLRKARYSEENHQGEAVLIFVTEPFLIEEQVKADSPTPENSVKVLKMNRIDRFKTGLYDYSQFTSVFTPVEKYDAMYPLKITMGSQDWCGQSFTQVNNKGGFNFEQKSYFESEGDSSFHMDYVVMEDNLMNIARLSTDLLPVGDFTVFPSISFLRSSHVEMKNYEALGSLDSLESGLFYVYEIPELRRSVRFFLSSEFDNRIMGWEESYPTVSDGKVRTSIYQLKGVNDLPYWDLNKKRDSSFRKEFNMIY